MPSVDPGDAVMATAEAIGAKPKWMEWTSSGNLGGTAKLPSGFRRMITLASGSRAETKYMVAAGTLAATQASWRAVIWAGNGSYILADGLTGIPLTGTPQVRLQENAPTKAVLRIAVRKGPGNVLDSDYGGWSDGHQEAVGRGMELTVEYRRPDGTMETVFRGMIYQVASGDVVEVTAYDRLMDLYQFSDQYQNGQDGTTVTLLKSDTPQSDPTYYLYTLVENPSLITLCMYRTKLTYYPWTGQTWDEHHEFDYTDYAHGLPVLTNAAFTQGSRIYNLYTEIFVFVPSGQTVSVSATVTFKIYEKSGGVLVLRDSRATTHAITRTSSGKVVFSATFSPYEIVNNPADYYIGASLSWSNTGGTPTFVVFPTSSTRKSTNYYAGNGSLSPIADSGELPELCIQYDYIGSVTPSSLQIAGNVVEVPQSLIPQATDSYVLQFAGDLAYEVTISYFATNGTAIRNVVEDLIEAAGLLPALAGGLDLGDTAYYTSSTFNYLDCLHELIRGAGHLLRASIATAGEVAVLPQHTVDDVPSLAFTTAPTGTGERSITTHKLTVNWMAEKATVAYLAENVTDSGLPIALETDDELMDGSLVDALQSPLRSISADDTLGTHRLMAVAAGGKVRQLHTNIIEGEIVLAGYRTDLWELTSASYAGGVPLRLIVPEYGFDGTAIPTALEFGDGGTKVTLDNIRVADRSEVARSMGLTADAISNTSQKLPATSYIFAKLSTYDTQETGMSLGMVTQVRWLLGDGSEAAKQDNVNLIKTVEDTAGYAHVCAVKDASVLGWAPTSPIEVVEFTMGGTTYKVPLDNPKYAIAGQRLHTDIRFRKA